MIKLTIVLLMSLSTSMNADIPKDHIQSMPAVVAPSTIGTQFNTVDGNGWYLEDNYNLQAGKECIVIFNNMGTEAIEDDEIISVVLIER